MKKLKKIMLIIIIVSAFMLLVRGKAFGAEIEDSLEEQLGIDELERAVPDSAEEILGHAEIVSVEKQTALLKRIAEYVKDNAGAQLKQTIKGTAAVMLIAILTGCVTSVFDVKYEYTVMAGVAGISAVTVNSTASFIALGKETLADISSFSKVLLPTLATAEAVNGAYTSAGAKYAVSVLFIDILITAIEKLVIPLICAYLAAGIASAAVGGEGLNAVVGFLKWFGVTIMTGIVIIFTGFLSITGIVSGSADATVQRVAKTAISTALPVVGSVVSDAAGALAAGAGMLKNAVGVFGMITVLAVCTVPILKIGCAYLTYKGAAALSGTVADVRITKLLNTIGTAFGMILGNVGAAAVMLFVSVIVSMKAVS